MKAILKVVNAKLGKELIIDKYQVRHGYKAFLYDSNNIEGEEQYLNVHMPDKHNRSWYLWDEWCQVGYSFKTLKALSVKFKNIIEA